MAVSTGGAPSSIHRALHACVLSLAGLMALGCAAAASAVIVLHLEIRPVLTGSMSPTYGPGALLVTKPVPVEDLHPGMIVLFVPPGEHAEFAHRITSMSGSPDAPIITTKGDANRSPDPWRARLRTDTVPVVIATQPWIGRLMIAFQGRIQVVFMVLGGLSLAGSGARWILNRRPVPTFSVR